MFIKSSMNKNRIRFSIQHNFAGVDSRRYLKNMKEEKVRWREREIEHIDNSRITSLPGPENRTKDEVHNC